MIRCCWHCGVLRYSDVLMRRSDGMVLRDHGLMRTCSYEWMRCCDGGVPRPDGVVRAGARKYFSGWKLKLYVSFLVLLSTGENTG